jgi:hypothetical protein
MNFSHASLVITLCISILLFITHDGYSDSSLKPTVKKSPQPVTKPHINSTPTKPTPRLTPLQPKMINRQKAPIVSVQDPYCFHNLYGGLKSTYGELSQLCAYSQYPSTQHYTTLRERIDFFYFNWNVSKCQTLVSGNIDRDVQHITFTKVPQSAARCGDKCFSKLAEEEDVRAMLGKCRNCCLFLPEEYRAQCKTGCQNLVEASIGQYIDGGGDVESAKEEFKQAIQAMRDLAQRQTENTGTLTEP